jgi:ABC-type phosphate transport system substrate-binding protein
MKSFSTRSFLSLLIVAAGYADFAPAHLSAQTPIVPASSPHTRVVAVVNVENPVTSLTTRDLRRILLGEMTQWPNGKNITIAMRSVGQPEHDAVLQLICGMKDADFERYVLQAAYRGEGQSSIKVLDTAAGVKRFVFNVPSSIGFIRADEVDSSVKVITITGSVPTSAAFGLTLRAQ